jgi:signal transduction histidine kinase
MTDRRAKILYYLVLISFSTILALLTFGQDNLTQLQNPQTKPDRSSPYFLYLNMVNWYLWICLTPLLIFLTRRYPLTRLKNISPHLLTSVFAALFVGEAGVLLKWLPLSSVFSFSSAFGIFYHNRNFIDDTLWGIVSYFIFAACGTVFCSYQKLRKKETEAAGMQEALTSAEFHSLKHSISPEFFLRSVDDILQVIKTSPEKADIMLVGLGSYLRGVLLKGSAIKINRNDEVVEINAKVDFFRICIISVFAVVSFVVIRIFVKSAEILVTGNDYRAILGTLKVCSIWLCWGLIAPLIYKFSIQRPLLSPQWKRSLIEHLLFQIAIWIVISVLLSAIHGWWIKLFEFQGLTEAAIFGLRQSQILLSFALYWWIIFLSQIIFITTKTADRQLELLRLKAQLNRVYLDALARQMQPHFLFNSLNTVAELVHDEPAKAESILRSIRELFRKTFEAFRRPETTLAEELKFMDDYLNIQKIRFGERLSVTYDIEDNCLNKRIPVMILQPIIENSIRHAFTQETGGKITISSMSANDYLQIRIEDNGSGQKPIVQRSGFGLKNVRERLQSMYGESNLLQTERSSDGFKVSLSIPQIQQGRSNAFITQQFLQPGFESPAES